MAGLGDQLLLGGEVEQPARAERGAVKDLPGGSITAPSRSRSLVSGQGRDVSDAVSAVVNLLRAPPLAGRPRVFSALGMRSMRRTSPYPDTAGSGDAFEVTVSLCSPGKPFRTYRAGRAEQLTCGHALNELVVMQGDVAEQQRRDVEVCCRPLSVLLSGRKSLILRGPEFGCFTVNSLVGLRIDGTANPCTPVRFRPRPPIPLINHGIDRLPLPPIWGVARLGPMSNRGLVSAGGHPLSPNPVATGAGRLGSPVLCGPPARRTMPLSIVTRRWFAARVREP